jgi:hypothetical protein
MNYFAGAILSEGELAGLIVYILVCGIAVLTIVALTIKILYALLKHKPLQKKYLAYIGVCIGLIILANILIELD